MNENKITSREKPAFAWRALALMSLLVATSVMLSAAPLTLEALTAEQRYQQTSNNPCIIGDPSCDQAGFPQTTLPPGASSYDSLSPVYTVGFLSGLFPSGFMVGVDVNQTNVVQTLSLFQMLVGGEVVDIYTGAMPGGTLVPPTEGGGNGNGWADYLLTGFTSLSGYDSETTVQFRAVMPLVNDGREQFFLIAAGVVPPPPTEIPEPASIAMIGGGLMLLGLWARRKRTA